VVGVFPNRNTPATATAVALPKNRATQPISVDASIAASNARDAAQQANALGVPAVRRAD